MSHKHVPMRTCVVCRQKFEKRHLMRFVRTDEGVFADPTGKRNGRGAYVCNSDVCLQQAANSNGLSKALRVGLTDSDRQRILEVAS